MRRWWLGLCMLALVATSTRVHAEAVPSKNQALLLLRILAYDRNLAARTDSKTVTLYVLHKSGATDSENAANQLAGVVREIAKSTKIAGNAVRVVKLAYNDKTLDADVGKAKGALYVAPGLGDAIGTIAAVTAKHDLLSFTGNAEYVAQGVAVGFSLDGGKPVISINLPASRNEGADLDVALLRVAKIVKK